MKVYLQILFPCSVVGLPTFCIFMVSIYHLLHAKHSKPRYHHYILSKKKKDIIITCNPFVKRQENKFVTMKQLNCTCVSIAEI